MIAEFRYINEAGFECFSVINNAEAVDHVWWSSKRNSMGRYDKHCVTVFDTFLKKLKNCKKVVVKVYYANR